MKVNQEYTVLKEIYVILKQAFLFSFFKPSIKDYKLKNFAVLACFPTHVVSHVIWRGTNLTDLDCRV